MLLKLRRRLLLEAKIETDRWHNTSPFDITMQISHGMYVYKVCHFPRGLVWLMVVNRELQIVSMKKSNKMCPEIWRISIVENESKVCQPSEFIVEKSTHSIFLLLNTIHVKIQKNAPRN